MQILNEVLCYVPVTYINGVNYFVIFMSADVRSPSGSMPPVAKCRLILKRDKFLGLSRFLITFSSLQDVYQNDGQDGENLHFEY